MHVRQKDALALAQEVDDQIRRAIRVAWQMHRECGVEEGTRETDALVRRKVDRALEDFFEDAREMEAGISRRDAC